MKTYKIFASQYRCKRTGVLITEVNCLVERKDKEVEHRQREFMYRVNVVNLKNLEGLFADAESGDIIINGCNCEDVVKEAAKKLRLKIR